MKVSAFHFRLYFYMLTCTLPLLVAAAGITERAKAEVELLIVCDKAFFDRFHNDRQKMIDYWKVYMWDVNMKFKTLASVDMSFRVTSLITISNTDDQPFIEQARQLNGRIALDVLQKKFQSWLYTNENRLTGFDVALLITGSDLLDEDQSSSSNVFENTVCLKSHSEKLFKSSIVLHSSATWGNTCNALDSSLASIMGAPSASEESGCVAKPSECNEDHYAMSDKNCNSGQYFFSHCSDKGIAKLLSSPQGACLREEAAPGKDVLKLSKVTHAPSLEDQCTMLTRSNKSTPIKGLNDCVAVKCRLGTLEYLSLIPLDNSPCDDKKVCFRGRCLPQGHLLRNVATGKCLRSRNRFSDQLEMMDCEESIATPMDKFMVYEKGAYKKFLATPILKQDKCLSADPLEFRYLRYYECSPEEEMLFGWDLMKVGHSGEFLLLHLHTMKCARVAENNGLVELVANCDKGDAQMRWIFVDSPVSTLGWFDNFDHFRKEEKCPL